jgi:hypothetical protein
MEAIEMLRSAGWYEGRRVDIRDDLDALRAEGFPVTDAAEAFLSEFSRLSIATPGDRNPLVIDAGAAAVDVFPGWAEAYSKAIGSTLVPVGEYSALTLYIDLDGGLWGGFDREYGRGGSSLAEVVQGLFMDQPGWRFDRKIEPSG